MIISLKHLKQFRIIKIYSIFHLQNKINPNINNKPKIYLISILLTIINRTFSNRMFNNRMFNNRVKRLNYWMTSWITVHNRMINLILMKWLLQIRRRNRNSIWRLSRIRMWWLILNMNKCNNFILDWRWNGESASKDKKQELILNKGI